MAVTRPRRAAVKRTALMSFIFLTGLRGAERSQHAIAQVRSGSSVTHLVVGWMRGRD